MLSFILSVTNKPFVLSGIMLSVVMLNIVILNVVAPIEIICVSPYYDIQHNDTQ
jgi:hypothetical protein